MMTWKTIFFWAVIFGGLCASVMAKDATAATGVHTIRHEPTSQTSRLSSRRHRTIDFQLPKKTSGRKVVQLTIAGTTTQFDPDSDYEHQGQGHIDDNMHLLRAVRLYRSLTRKTVVVFTKRMPQSSALAEAMPQIRPRLIISKPGTGKKLHRTMPTVPRQPKHKTRANRLMVLAR